MLRRLSACAPLLLLACCSVQRAPSEVGLDAVVPADAVVAYAEHVTADDRDRLERWIPQLADVPLSSTPSSIAVLQDDGETGWVMLTKTIVHATLMDGITASSDHLRTLVGTGTDVLAGSTAYQSLAALRSGDVWAFLPSPVNAPLVPAGSRALGIESSPSQLRIAILGPWPANHAAIDQNLSIPHSADIVLRAGDGMSLASLTHMLDRNERITMQSLVQTAVEEVLGNDASLTGDIAPLLTEPFTLTLRTTATDNPPLWLLAGSATRSLDKQLDALHERFARHLPSMSIQEREFEDRFFSRTIELDPAPVEQDTWTTDGWMYRESKHKLDESTFVTAMNEHQFVFGNDTDALQSLTASASIVTLHTDHPLIAGGLLRPDSLGTMLTPLLQPLLAAAPSDAEILEWTLEETDDLAWILTMRKR